MLCFPTVSLTDTSIQHTYAVHERVPVWLLVVLVIRTLVTLFREKARLTIRISWVAVVPLGIFAIVSLVCNRNIWDFREPTLCLCGSNKADLVSATDSAALGLILAQAISGYFLMIKCRKSKSYTMLQHGSLQKRRSNVQADPDPT